MIQVTIANWGKFNARADRSNFSWFRFENTFFHDQAVFSLTDSARVLYIFLLCEASKKNSAEVVLKTEYIAAILGRDINSVHDDLNKLNELELVAALRHQTVASCHQTVASCRHDDTVKKKADGVTPSYRQTDKQTDKSVENKDSLSADADPHPLARIWNEHSGKLAKVKGWNRNRQRAADLRWGENTSTEYWTEVVRSIAASAFCNGSNDRSWRADFNWLLQPDVHLKVSEGRYSNRRASQSELLKSPEDFAREEEARLQAELANIFTTPRKEPSDVPSETA